MSFPSHVWCMASVCGPKRYAFVSLMDTRKETQPMTEHSKDILAGLLFTAMILGLLLGAWAVLRLMVY